LHLSEAIDPAFTKAHFTVAIIDALGLIQLPSWRVGVGKKS
jgi:hypothetical protein